MFPIDNKWHHIAAYYNGKNNFYMTKLVLTNINSQTSNTIILYCNVKNIII